MGKLTEKLLEEILEAFASKECDQNPSDELLRWLADASGKLERSIRHEYTRLYQEINKTDDDPLDPPLPMRG
jgi:ERCC4-type nuclease